MIYGAVATGGLVSVEMIVVNSVHGEYHLMVKAIAAHGRINLVTIFH